MVVCYPAACRIPTATGTTSATELVCQNALGYLGPARGGRAGDICRVALPSILSLAQGDKSQGVWGQSPQPVECYRAIGSLSDAPNGPVAIRLLMGLPRLPSGTPREWESPIVKCVGLTLFAPMGLAVARPNAPTLPRIHTPSPRRLRPIHSPRRPQGRQDKTARQANGGSPRTGPRAGPALGSDAQSRPQSPIESGRVTELPKAQTRD